MTRVLLIEDDTSLARSLLSALGDDGHEVEWAMTSLSAQRLLHDHGERFQVLLVDYEFPAGPGAIADGQGTRFIDRYQGDALTILWSGLDRDREVERECPTRRPDHVLVKTSTLEVLDLIAAAGIA